MVARQSGQLGPKMMMSWCGGVVPALGHTLLLLINRCTIDQCMQSGPEQPTIAAASSLEPTSYDNNLHPPIEHRPALDFLELSRVPGRTVVTGMMRAHHHHSLTAVGLATKDWAQLFQASHYDQESRLVRWFALAQILMHSSRDDLEHRYRTWTRLLHSQQGFPFKQTSRETHENKETSSKVSFSSPDRLELNGNKIEKVFIGELVTLPLQFVVYPPS